MAKKTRKIFSYGSMSLSIFRRFVLTLIFSISCLFVSLKVLSIYAQEVAESPSIAPEATIEQPVDIPVQTDNSPSVPDAPSASETPTDIPTDSSVNSDPSSDTTSEVPQVSDPIPEVPTVSPEASPEASSEISSPSSSESSTPETSTSSEQSTIDSDPEVIMAELIAVLLGEAEKEAEENPEKDPEDTTDEDPNVDLQDLSLVSQAPAPELEPMISVAEIQEEELSESTDSSASLISLLDSGVDTIPLLTRIVSEEINTDIAARHSCRLEKFRADVSESSALKMRVKFLAGPKGDYEAEIGSLPTGIDVVFAQNREYIYSFVSRDTVLDLEIINQLGSFDGDFSIPIIYRKKGKQDSSVICQMNLRNEIDSSGS